MLSLRTKTTKAGWFYHLWLLDQTVNVETPLLTSSWPSHIKYQSIWCWLTESVSFQRILYFDQAVGGVSSSTVAIDSELKGNEELVWEPVSNKNSQVSRSELGTLQELFLPEDVNSDLAIGQIINANATFSLLEGIFKHQALFYNSQTQFMPRPAVVNKLVKLGTVTLGSSYHYPLKSGFRNSKYDLDTRVSFKYSVSRGVSSTPTFYVNVFELLDAGSPIDFEGWKNTIDP
ncbi:hypothetical protein YC2023_075769 [Brassica napus]